MYDEYDPKDDEYLSTGTMNEQPKNQTFDLAKCPRNEQGH